MVLAGKIFKLEEPAELSGIASKLKNYRREDFFTEEDKKLALQTEIQELSLRQNMLRGVFSQDKIIHIRHHGDVSPIPRTIEAIFTITSLKNNLMLSILEKKLQANNVANQLSEILFITKGKIVEARITSENLRRFHEENPQGTKVIFFDNVDIPNINKLSLYGPDLANTSLYSEYLKHGDIWYAVLTSKRHGNIVGVTRSGIVTIFNKIDPTEFLSYISDEIFPMLEA